MLHVVPSSHTLRHEGSPLRSTLVANGQYFPPTSSGKHACIQSDLGHTKLPTIYLTNDHVDDAESRAQLHQELLRIGQRNCVRGAFCIVPKLEIVEVNV